MCAATAWQARPTSGPDEAMSFDSYTAGRSTATPPPVAETCSPAMNGVIFSRAQLRVEEAAGGLGRGDRSVAEVAEVAGGGCGVGVANVTCDAGEAKALLRVQRGDRRRPTAVSSQALRVDAGALGRRGNCLGNRLAQQQP